MSQIQITVEWERPVALAGQDVQCVLTFKNVSASAKSRLTKGFTQGDFSRPPDVRLRQHVHANKTSLQGVGSSVSEGRPRIHQPSSSLQVSKDKGDLFKFADLEKSNPRQKHRRSVSILSITSPSSFSREQMIPRAPRSHGSRQVSTFMSRPKEDFKAAERSFDLPTAARNDETSTTLPESIGVDRPGPWLDAGDYNAKGGPAPEKLHPGLDGHGDEAYLFEPVVPKARPVQLHRGHTTNMFEMTKYGTPQRAHSIGTPNATPRSSIDIYSQSNHSSDTMASDYLPAFTQQPISVEIETDQSSLGTLEANSIEPITLMMGYVQLVGAFTLDGSLVNLSPFEKVKKRSVIGGQAGGGVVGIEHSRKKNGILGSFGWPNWGNSIGGILAGNDPSSFREMKDIANTRAIPIISTPQSVLFVDLTLHPGESKSFAYVHKLPTAIPPSFKGRTFKSIYHLLIGVQRQQGSLEQPLVRHVEAPFRVLPTLDEHGETPQHDLMVPHVYLHDMARVGPLQKNPGNPGPNDRLLSRQNLDVCAESMSPASPHKLVAVPRTSFDAFVRSYLKALQQTLTANLASPMEPGTITPRMVGVPVPEDRRSLPRPNEHLAAVSNVGTTLFNICRGRDKVAEIKFTKATCRLGETLPVMVDFRGADTRCYALCASLETVEGVNSSVALRSDASIARATRRVYVQTTRNTVCCETALLEFMVPGNSTPEFATSGINMRWILRFTFSTGNPTASVAGNARVLEPTTFDERATVSSAVQELQCENLDVTLPVRVRGFLADSYPLQKPINLVL